MGTIRKLLLMAVFSTAAGSAAAAPSPAPADEGFDELGAHYLSRFLVVPEHNLLFCWMEVRPRGAAPPRSPAPQKVGCSAFNDLFRSLRERYDPKMSSAKAYGANSAWKFGWTTHDIEAALHNRTWHKAVFYREPLERFVSAFKSKCVKGADKDGKKICGSEFAGGRPTFSAAVRHFVSMDASKASDSQNVNPHWKRQTRFCGGLVDTLKVRFPRSCSRPVRC